MPPEAFALVVTIATLEISYVSKNGENKRPLRVGGAVLTSITYSTTLVSFMGVVRISDIRAFHDPQLPDARINEVDVGNAIPM